MNVGGETTDIAAAGDVGIGGLSLELFVGGGHTCALLSSGAVRCWGMNNSGLLGYGRSDDVGDGVGPSIVVAGDVPVWE